MMTTKEMRQILADKLKAENTYFKKSDISIKKHGESYKIIIKDYEHIPFEIKFEYENYTHEFMTYVYADSRLYEMIDNKTDYDIKSALMYIGYYIGTRF